VEFDGRRKLSLLFDIKEWLQENAMLPLKETNFSVIICYATTILLYRCHFSYIFPFLFIFLEYNRLHALAGASYK
jgi:hypothetical protein